MLFDLRGRGRQRSVKVVYGGLALLMGLGLVLFGIGGATSGGLVDAFSGGNSGGTTDIYRNRIEQAQTVLQRDPNNQAALVTLARNQVGEASQYLDSTSGAYSAEAGAPLAAADRAWQRYLALDPERPDAGLASTMSQVYQSQLADSPTRALQAFQIVADSREPSSGLFVQLAQLGYLAGRTRTGDLAADRAVQLADKDQRKTLRSTLAQVKTQAAQARSGAGAAGTGAAAGAASAPAGAATGGATTTP